MRPKRALVIAGLALAFGGGPLAAQRDGHIFGLRRTILESHDLPGTGDRFVQALTEIGPDAALPRHTHPGPEIMYVLRGSLRLGIRGEPARQLAQGQTAFIPAGVPNGGRAGAEGASLLLTWVLPKGRPLASPAK